MKDRGRRSRGRVTSEESSPARVISSLGPIWRKLKATVLKANPLHIVSSTNVSCLFHGESTRCCRDGHNRLESPVQIPDDGVSRRHSPVYDAHYDAYLSNAITRHRADFTEFIKLRKIDVHEPLRASKYFFSLLNGPAHYTPSIIFQVHKEATDFLKISCERLRHSLASRGAIIQAGKRNAEAEKAGRPLFNEISKKLRRFYGRLLRVTRYAVTYTGAFIDRLEARV
ncbi:uncharacterized protein LOC143218663 [Lasioglossum baleicum]|uniref:uncharacterized protein LOC143218663 n=1 Tax=Lasioglossum baleicum TaxID=434251 RepID=UPI003FCD214F